MIVLFILLLLILGCMLAFQLTTKAFINPYTLTMVFGKKGAGKSSYLAKLALQHACRGWTVYSTLDIAGTFSFNPNDLGVFYTPSELASGLTVRQEIDLDYCKEHYNKRVYRYFRDISKVKPTGNVLILIDEVGMIWDNRNFKNFSDSTRNWFKLQRHYRCKVVLFSQSFDVDKKIRDLCDDMWLIQKKLRVFSYGKHILRRLDIAEGDAVSGESKLIDVLKFDSLFFFFLGSRSMTYLPRWSCLFDSFYIEDLRTKIYKYQLPQGNK